MTAVLQALKAHLAAEATAGRMQMPGYVGNVPDINLGFPAIVYRVTRIRK